MSHNITVEGGKSVRLPTAGKYCAEDVIITATGGDTQGAYNEGYNAGYETGHNEGYSHGVSDGWNEGQIASEEALNGVITEQEALVTELKSVLDGKMTGGGVELPTLHNEGFATDLLLGKQLIDSNGNVVEGTMQNNGEILLSMDGINTKRLLIPDGYTSGGMVSLDNTIDNEVNDQADLISQIMSTVDSLPEAGSGGTDTRFADMVMDKLTTVNDSTITELRPYAFQYCTNLLTVRLPNVRISATSIFRDCTNLQSVDLPELSGTSGGSVFVYCSSLTSVNIPKVTSLNTYVFQYCTALKKLDLGNLASIGAGAFKDSGLETLIIRRTGTTVTTLSNANALDGTPIADGTGYIYVPSALIDKFKSATNWSTYASQIRAIEDYPEICGG